MEEKKFSKLVISSFLLLRIIFHHLLLTLTTRISLSFIIILVLFQQRSWRQARHVHGQPQQRRRLQQQLAQQRRVLRRKLSGADDRQVRPNETRQRQPDQRGILICRKRRREVGAARQFSPLTHPKIRLTHCKVVLGSPTSPFSAKKVRSDWITGCLVLVSVVPLLLTFTKH